MQGVSSLRGRYGDSCLLCYCSELSNAGGLWCTSRRGSFRSLSCRRECVEFCTEFNTEFALRLGTMTVGEIVNETRTFVYSGLPVEGDVTRQQGLNSKYVPCPSTGTPGKTFGRSNHASIINLGGSKSYTRCQLPIQSIPFQRLTTHDKLIHSKLEQCRASSVQHE